MNRILVLLSFALLSSSGFAAPESQISPGWHHSHLENGKSPRYFRYYIPEKMAKNASLVILLHGGTRSMDKLFNKDSGGLRQCPNLAGRW